MMLMELDQRTVDYVRAHREENVRDLALHAKHGGVDMPWALDQIAGWQTARVKLPQWAACDGIIYPPHLSMEQCSSEATAQYKALLVRRLVAPSPEPPHPGTAASAATARQDSGAGAADGNDRSGEWRDCRSATSQHHASDTNTHREHRVGTRPRGPAPADSGTGEAETAAHGSMVDLTGGFGVDCSYMARLFAHATYVERQPQLCDIAAHNMAVLGLGHVRVVNADAERYLADMEPVDVIYLDPARRDEHGDRTYAIADCTPDVLGMKDLLLRKSRYVVVKLSPMLDWRKAVADFAGVVAQVHIVAVGNECKELLLVLHGERAASVDGDTAPGAWSANLQCVHCVNITPHGEQRFAFTPSGGMGTSGDIGTLDDTDVTGDATATSDATTTSVATATGDADTSGKQAAPSAITKPPATTPHTPPDAARMAAGWYLYEPNAAIMKAGCFDELAARFGVAPVASNSHLMVAPTPVAGFPGRAFRIDAITAMGKKELRAALAGITHANIAVRNFPMSVAQLRKKLKLKDGGDTYLFATTTRDGRHIIIRTSKV